MDSEESDDESDDEETLSAYRWRRKQKGTKQLQKLAQQTHRPYYNPVERVKMFIVGVQNCGRGYFVSEFLKTYRMMHPKRPVCFDCVE